MAIDVGQGLSGRDVVATLERLRFERGLPQRIYGDNGTAFVSAAMDLWAYSNGVILDFSRRGKPTDNAAIESFTGRFREECLNVHWLRLSAARATASRMRSRPGARFENSAAVYTVGLTCRPRVRATRSTAP
jgi:putative transposase